MWTHIQELKTPKYPVLSMIYTLSGLYTPVTSIASGSAKQFLKTALVQAGTHMKTFQVYAFCQDNQSGGVIQPLGQHQLLERFDDILKQESTAGLFQYKSVQGILGHNNKPGLAIFQRLFVESSAYKKAYVGAL